MHGLGNDFIVVDLRAAPTLGLDADEVVRLCDRRLGIGADGVLSILPQSAAAPGAMARLRIQNADGSEAEMCGNGLRCVARYLAEHDETGADSIAVETGAGVLTCELTRQSAGGAVESICIAMGAPRLERDELRWPLPLTSDAEPLLITAISMGNPHAVAFFDDERDLLALASRLGPHVERHPFFPNRTNAEFARKRSDGSFELVVWERGCGITRACGTGACATAVAATRLGLAETDRFLLLDLPGGRLEVKVAGDGTQVYLRGPAAFVYSGEVAVRLTAARENPAGG